MLESGNRGDEPWASEPYLGRKKARSPTSIPDVIFWLGLAFAMLVACGLIVFVLPFAYAKRASDYWTGKTDVFGGHLRPDAGTMSPLGAEEFSNVATSKVETTKIGAKLSAECPATHCPSKCSEKGLCMRDPNGVDCACACHADYDGADCGHWRESAAGAHTATKGGDQAGSDLGDTFALPGSYGYTGNTGVNVLGLDLAQAGYGTKLGRAPSAFQPGEPYDDPDAKGYTLTEGVGFTMLVVLLLAGVAGLVVLAVGYYRSWRAASR